MDDKRNVFEVLIPKLKAATEKFDMIPVRDQAYFPPQNWEDGDEKLPGALEPYFLKSGSGPKYLVGGSIIRPLATTAETAGKFTVGSIEGSSHPNLSGILAKGQSIKFKSTHHCFQVVDGAIDFSIDGGAAQRLNAGELVYVPAGTQFRFEYAARFAKAYVFASGGGLLELLIRLGQEYNSSILPEKAAQWDGSELQGLGDSFGYSLL